MAEVNEAFIKEILALADLVEREGPWGCTVYRSASRLTFAFDGVAPDPVVPPLTAPLYVPDEIKDGWEDRRYEA
jgi:hypothetical protein